MWSPFQPDLVWECPDDTCPEEALGDMDSPYAADLCPQHEVPLVLSDRVHHHPDGRGK